MKHLDVPELRERMRDILFNFHDINHRSQVTPSTEDMALFLWVGARMTEIRQEIALRPGCREEEVLADILAADVEKYPTASDPALNRIARAVDQSDEPEDPYLVKYGEHEHMKAMLETGEVLIRPAAEFVDENLDPEIRDEELQAQMDLDPERAELTAFRRTGAELGPLQPERIKLTKRARGNYYLYSLSQSLRTRHFLDFGEGYDAAVVITEIDSFIERITEAVGRTLPGWIRGGGPVKYYDPLIAVPDQINVLTHKHFRYAYQREYRFVWVPPDEGTKRLDRFKVYLGNLDYFAELVSPLHS